ncbi:hypothetical protein SLEP1_g15055 [Rubroshorea leprosula]|nr:hypothetical protein SLEP1_g15055 [Rubroshorea leprosula]
MDRVKTPDLQKVGSSLGKRKFDGSRRRFISAPPKFDTGKGSKELRVAKTVGQASIAQHTHLAPPICLTCGRVGHTRDQCHINTGLALDVASKDIGLLIASSWTPELRVLNLHLNGVLLIRGHRNRMSGLGQEPSRRKCT